MRVILRNATIIGILLFCSSWGFLVHRTVSQLAVYELPIKMRPFFYMNLDYLVKESVKADLRRNSDPHEAPRHFIDLEKYGDSAGWKMPMKWDAARRIFGRDSLEKFGYVPYEVLYIKERLTVAFRAANRDSILYYAADLGHYIADTHVPLHVTVNYDGQLTNQKGLHSLWETMVPEIEIDHYTLYSQHKANYLKDPSAAIWAAVRESQSLLGGVFEQEKLVSTQFADSAKYRFQERNGKSYRTYTSAFAKAYSQKLGSSINDQLLHSADMIADFWFSAWMDAGSPDLGSLCQHEYSRADKKGLKRQCKAFRQNLLIQKNLLLARNQASAQGD